MNSRNVLLAAGLLGALGVGLGAFGAHGLRVVLAERGTSNAWETAVRYQLWHAIGLLGLAIWLRQGADAAAATLGWAARCWTGGVVIFSGSLYALALGGPRWLGPITPFGGVALMIGWLLLAVIALRRRETP